MTAPRHVFYISDRTGLTAENIGEALLNQFGNLTFKRSTFPFIDTPEKAQLVVDKVNQCAADSGQRPIAFVSVVNTDIRKIISSANALHINFFDTFLGTLEEELNTEAVQATQGHHSIGNTQRYDARMEAVNFSLNHDDGVSDKNLKEADVILMGVSRSGKTPTCLYLALQYGIRAANYPLIPDDLESSDLPRMVKPYKDKLFGLTIQPERLQAIRQERRPNSTYARIDTCRSEVADAQAMFKRHGIPFTNTTDKSVEELAVYIMQACHLKRRF
ncbi:posphoenolpyruvate synthetase regulatory kinase/phosphorylase PpsR [Neisseria perflava]|uniref:posphoenolpyruvate synthetase regulatory kinase/phosphorylase PpsR n=1 Tax=Neisseria perflava TaxID=33053 RepID=UPI0020A201DE|nr:pyruvate, water dikinase regulatory protein [Neisseria perflava]MCP1659892.1 regulator of PEP synthase PpsR (kinase-PPPase family) [Neisseria perflava]MCP1773361.1 regulator of PEP synthase PpsR (kinase-PPPase family) [Neisseria perflava]